MKGEGKMISEMKREALQSLKGKWGLGVGSTILQFVLNYIVSLVVSLIVIIPVLLFIMAIGDSVYAFEEERQQLVLLFY